MRTTTTAVSNALSRDNVPMLCLVQMDFTGGTVRCCNAGYPFDWGGHTWLGLGQLGSISAVQEGSDLQEYGLALTLSGIDPNQIALSQDPADYYQRPCTIWLAPLDDNYLVLADPVIVFAGRMDTMVVKLGSTATIQMTVESKLTDWNRPRIRRYNHEDQTSEYPEDMGLQYVTKMVEAELKWGRA